MQRGRAARGDRNCRIGGGRRGLAAYLADSSLELESGNVLVRSFVRSFVWVKISAVVVLDSKQMASVLLRGRGSRRLAGSVQKGMELDRGPQTLVQGWLALAASRLAQGSSPHKQSHSRAA
jgi:hypothetical protein